MLSLYAQYLAEKTNDRIIETENSFATYRYLDDGITVYIVDIFVLPSIRNSGWASCIADEIVTEAKKRGCIKLLGSVVTSSKNSTVSLKILLAYGMTLDSASNDFIVFRKDI